MVQEAVADLDSATDDDQLLEGMGEIQAPLDTQDKEEEGDDEGADENGQSDQEDNQEEGN